MSSFSRKTVLQFAFVSCGGVSLRLLHCFSSRASSQVRSRPVLVGCNLSHPCSGNHGCSIARAFPLSACTLPNRSDRACWPTDQFMSTRILSRRRMTRPPSARSLRPLAGCSERRIAARGFAHDHSRRKGTRMQRLPKATTVLPMLLLSMH